MINQFNEFEKQNSGISCGYIYHLESRWRATPISLASPWPQQPNSPPNMGSFFVAPSTFETSPRPSPPPPGPFLSVMQLSTHQREGYTEKGRQNQPPVHGCISASNMKKNTTPENCSQYGKSTRGAVFKANLNI